MCEWKVFTRKNSAQTIDISFVPIVLGGVELIYSCFNSISIPIEKGNEKYI